MKVNETDEYKIRLNIFNFYANNKEICDDNYNLAENKDIDKIYVDVKDEMDKNSLFTKTSLIILTANKYEKNILHQRIYMVNQKKLKE